MHTVWVHEPRLLNCLKGGTSTPSRETWYSQLSKPPQHLLPFVKRMMEAKSSGWEMERYMFKKRASELLSGSSVDQTDIWVTHQMPDL